MRYPTPHALFLLAISALTATIFHLPPCHAAETPVEVYQGGLKNGWRDWGWAHRELVPGAPAKLHMNRYAGWILAHKDLTGLFVSLTVTVRAPLEFGDFLEVRLGRADATTDAFPKVALPRVQGTPDTNGFLRYTVPLGTLNPSNEPFDRIVLRANKQVDERPVEVASISLTPAAPGQMVQKRQRPSLPKRTAHVVIDCRAPKKEISPLIYGIAFAPRRVGQDAHLWQLGSSIRRWGGNPASRYNWRLGHAWNTASDWFFHNVNYTGVEDYSWKSFLQENAEHKTLAAMTVPTLGWVAKDTSSYSFSVSRQGAQKYAQGDMGNGIDPQGKKLPSPDPQTTSVAASPKDVAAWVSEMEAFQNSNKDGAIAQYILDNEPALWNSTHRDVHPEPLSYDELLQKTIAYGSQIRRAAPTADIAGPAEWGWPAYFYSAKDAEAGFRIKPDRRAHGDVPLMDWYLHKLKQHHDRTGETLLNTLDLHYYPQTNGIYSHDPSLEDTSVQGAKKRLRATRSLWDPTYVDESWIAEKIALLPRMQKLIDDNYPGRGISIGEYNFGGLRHISGGLALAEALGRFGQANVRSAYMWTYPSANTHGFAAFLAYRNYDGAGAQFPNQGLVTRAESNISVFAAQDPDKKRLVAIALNLNDDFDASANIELVGCGDYKRARAFLLDATAPTLQPQQPAGTVSQHRLEQLLPGYSLTVLELTR